MSDAGHVVSIELATYVADEREQGTALDEPRDLVTPSRPYRFPIACDSWVGVDRTPTSGETGAFGGTVCVPS